MTKLNAEQQTKLMHSLLYSVSQGDVTIKSVRKHDQVGGLPCPSIAIEVEDPGTGTIFEIKALLSIEALDELGIDSAPYLVENYNDEEE